MTDALSLIDRARIERLVWSLDQRLYDLPYRARIATRREVRQNLVTAARDVGIGNALAQVGSPAQLAADYLDAEFGNQPRPSLIAAAVFFATVLLFATSLLFETADAFGKGVAAADPTASGMFTSTGVEYLQSKITYTFTNGDYTYVGGALTPLAYALLVLGSLCVGRLWRYPAVWSRRRAARRQAHT